MTTIAIVGAGMMGTALCWPLVDNGHTVRLVGTPLDEEIIASLRSNGRHPRLQRQVPQGVMPFSHTELSRALQGVELIVNGVSSFGIPWFAETLAPYLSPEAPVLAVTKGLEDQENGDLLILPEAVDRRLPASLRGQISLNAIGGPCIAHELAARRQTAVVFTGNEPGILAGLAQIFATGYYHVRTSTDVVGVEVCAALKNAYALGVGLAVGMLERHGPDGLANMYNPQAGLFAQGCLEMRRFLAFMGGKADNVSGLPGAGDLYVTVFGGRTVRLGRLLGQGTPFAEAQVMMAGETLESVEIIRRVARALPKLEARGLAQRRDFPLLNHMDNIIHSGEKVDIPWDQFFDSGRT